MEVNYGLLIKNIPNNLKSKIRAYERCLKKVNLIKWSIEFNSTCLNEGILPKYSKFKYHDPAVANTVETHNYRKFLVNREIESKGKQLTKLKCEKQQLETEIELYQINDNIKQPILEILTNIINNHNLVTKTRISKKLNTLYSGYHCFKNSNYGSRIMFIQLTDRFINLSTYNLSKDEIDFLNLGLNCHLQPKYDQLIKKMEIESLYQNIINLENKSEITVNPNISNYLLAESSKNRFVKTPSVLNTKLRQAAKNLRENKNIVVKKADKASIYVILDKKDYIDSMNNILSDQTKFIKLQKDPTNSFKIKANKLISINNAAQNMLKLPKIVGDYQSGYIYRTVKTHKNNNPLRPIISQVLTPTYNLAKTLNNIITPYIPGAYMLESTNQFIDLLNSNECIGITASLDVESLFTNVPIDDTIDIIIQHVYNHPTLHAPKISQNILKQLLQLCTKELPFKSPDGSLYKQVDGVAMGSPLGPCFSNFYMGNLENKIFENSNLKPNIYGRYVDDIFLQIANEQQLIQLKDEFESKSVLKFTYELSVHNKLPFLDVLVNTNNNEFHTTVYRKETNMGFCLNAKSECINKYKQSVISSYVTRAFKITRSWEDFHLECQKIKQILINNNFSNKMVDLQINKFLQQKLNNQKNLKIKDTINIFYKNQTHKNCHLDEKILKDIVKNNIKPTSKNKKININIYYKNNKTYSLIMKNNPSPPTSDLNKNNVIYQFSCPLQEPNSNNICNGKYVGMTSTTLLRRLTAHKYNGSIKQHFIDYHNEKIKQHHLEENTSIIDKATNRRQLLIKEALIISKLNPSINIQYSCFSQILQLHSSAIKNNKNSSSKQDMSPRAPENINIINKNINIDNGIISHDNITPAIQSHGIVMSASTNPPTTTMSTKASTSQATCDMQAVRPRQSTHMTPPNSNQSSIQITSNIQANGSTQPTSINIMPHSSINSTNELTLISPALQNNINNVIRSARQKMGGSQLPPSPTLPTCQH